MPARSAQSLTTLNQPSPPLSAAASAVLQLEQSLTHSRDSNRSSSGWERLKDGTWFRREYYQLNEQMPRATLECGTHVLNNIFTGSFDVVRNVEWMKSKDIHRVLVLGTVDVPTNEQYRLRIVPITEGQLDLYLDSIVSLIIEAVAEDANVLLVDKDNRTFNPACLVAYLLCSGWAFDWALERIEGIYRIAFTQHKLQSLKNWDQVMDKRRTELVTDVKNSQSYNMPKILQSPLPLTTSGESVVVTSVPPYSTTPVVKSLPVVCPPPSTVRDVLPALPARIPKVLETLAATSIHDVTPTTTDQWGPRTKNSTTAIQNILRRYDTTPEYTAHRETMTA